MRNPILEMQVSDMMLEFAEEYAGLYITMTTSDLQGYVGAKAYDIINLINESEQK